jgi:hypothetical protein
VKLFDVYERTDESHRRRDEACYAQTEFLMAKVACLNLETEPHLSVNNFRQRRN